MPASERLSIGDLALSIESPNESVTIHELPAPIQTASAERYGVITSSQIDSLLVRGRNITSLV